MYKDRFVSTNFNYAVLKNSSNIDILRAAKLDFLRPLGIARV